MTEATGTYELVFFLNLQYSNLIVNNGTSLFLFKLVITMAPVPVNHIKQYSVNHLLNSLN